MPRNRSHWFAFYADDYIAGTRDMTAQARGVYVDLLCYQFTHGDIPADDRKICRIAGIFPDEWEEVRDEVLEKFDAQEGGKLRNHRMESEREKREEIRQKRIQAVNKRADRRPTSVASSGVTSVDTSEDTIGVTSTTTTTTKKKTLSPAREEIGRDIPTWEQVRQAAANMMIDESVAERFFDDMEACGWIDSRSRPIQNFQPALKVWANRYHDNEARRNQNGGGPRPNGNRVDRNAGTSNAGRASEYRNV